jgi:hypothetical protein
VITRIPRIEQLMADLFLRVLFDLGGYYEAPIHEPTGEIIGRVVPYAGTYVPEGGGEPRHFVGPQYCNLAKLEEELVKAAPFIEFLAEKVRRHRNSRWSPLAPNPPLYVLAAPMGALTLGPLFAKAVPVNYGFLEKKVLAVGGAGRRDKTELIESRHVVPMGADVIIFEDVCNHRSTAGEMAKRVHAAGSQVIAIACILNRTWPSSESWVNPCDGVTIPVISAAHIPMIDFMQEDPAVSSLIERGYLMANPKDQQNWSQLLREMNHPPLSPRQQ